MRTERPEPWGYDVWDPRLTLRQLAADAQRSSIADASDVDEPAALDDPPATEPREPELIGGAAK